IALKRNNLVLDMDETLLHAELDTGCYSSPPHFRYVMDGKQYALFIRPHVSGFIKHFKDFYNIILYSAGSDEDISYINLLRRNTIAIDDSIEATELYRDNTVS
ncbi:hypothetical protein B4U80_12173, partial [Leptotrombidium deliense]